MPGEQWWTESGKGFPHRPEGSGHRTRIPRDERKIRMKNIRSYRIPALLLAVILLTGILPVSAHAIESNPTVNGSQGYIFNATENAVFAFSTGGKEAGSAADLDPNKVNTLTVTVSDSDGLPKDTKGQIIVTIPEGFSVQADSIQSDDVAARYIQTRRQFVFTWKNERKAGFSATVSIFPETPATREDISGTHLLVIRNANSQGRQWIMVQPILQKIDNTDRLTCVVGQLFDGGIIARGTDRAVWKFSRVSGDWYSISAGGKYLNFGKNGNNISLTDQPQYFLYAREGAGDQFIAFADNGTRYYLNNKSNDAGKGIQASTYKDQYVELRSAYSAGENGAIVTFSVNGGSVAATMDPVLTEKGKSIILPDYAGTKNNTPFIGWAAVADIYTAYNGSNNTYCEVYLPGTDYLVTDNAVTLYAVYNEKGTDVRFGFRNDGKIPDEPGNYAVSNYSGHFEIKNALKLGKWIVDVNNDKPVEGNHVANDVTANLNIIPSDEQIKAGMPKYDPETMYVHWYVMKYAGQWKIDGVLRTRSANSVAYHANIDGTIKEQIENFPLGYELKDQQSVIVGADADGREAHPTLAGYTFLGWSTSPDSREMLYQTGEIFPVTGSVSFYAQWEKIPKYKLSFSMENAARDTVLPEPKEYAEMEQILMPRAEDRDGYFFSGWYANGERINGDTFTMPAEDVEISGQYYGPIDVEILSDWEDGKVGFSGATITLTTEPDGPEGLDYSYQWQYFTDGTWTDVENETGITMTYELNKETSGRTWRVIITDVRPRTEE